MSIKVGDIDVTGEIIDLRFQLIRTQLLLDKLTVHNPNFQNVDIDSAQIEEEALEILQKRFPNMGIYKK
jgi:hypothetical protein